jgi:hypothetical protein
VKSVSPPEGKASRIGKVFLPTIRVTTLMKTNQASTRRSHPNECRYALRRGVDYWTLVFEGQETTFKHELGALYVACLLLNPPKEPLHAVALALKARDMAKQPAEPGEVLQPGVERPIPSFEGILRPTDWWLDGRRLSRNANQPP